MKENDSILPSKSRFETFIEASWCIVLEGIVLNGNFDITFTEFSVLVDYVISVIFIYNRSIKMGKKTIVEIEQI
ncbi:hypothetical protein BpHYR1_002535 [Brachionus plicatilis]|uniref:Uncharacterized protein n=1 Tax=Brachionus plicatilis TaxID=10195 RepID=A0A3M7SQW4_BRAPC|nr:hypothetical protein BpHYR1_002535 [Brachionus plicatilis]